MTSQPDSTTSISPPLHPWLARIPKVFEGIAPELIRRLGSPSFTRLGADFYSIKTARPELLHESDAARFLRWKLPLDHSWPCNPQKMEGFIEKAAQTLVKKFKDRRPQGIFVGLLNPTSPDRYYRSLASNLRGRLLQVFPGLTAASVEDQNPGFESLFCLVGKEGLFCGMQSPRLSNGFYPGGSKYIDQDSPDTISRAGAKIAEALHYLQMYRPPLPAGSHWLELGACPGGMTSELLARNQCVTAIDKAPLDKRLDGRKGLRFVHMNATEFQPAPRDRFDALLSDMNGPPEESITEISRLSHWLRKGGLVVFTLKLPKVEDIDTPCAILRRTIKSAASAGLRLLAQTHLTYNRHEFTLFLEKS